MGMCACVHVLGMETVASHSQARTPAPSLTPVRMLWMHELCPEVLSNRWAENRKGITLRGSCVCQLLVCPRVKAKSNFQEAEKGMSWPGLSSGQGRGLSPGDLKVGCCAQGLVLLCFGEPDCGDQWPYSVAGACSC